MHTITSEAAPAAAPHPNTRLDAFVDAAFAFSVTLLVISADRIPDSVDSLLLALKALPSFAASFAMVAVFWHAHVSWSRRYPLQSTPAVLLSLLLVFLVLVYVYPLRLLFGTFFAWATGGWLPMPLREFAPGDVVSMYIVYGVAFSSMSACMAGLYAHAWRRRQALGLKADDAAAAAGDMATYLYLVLVGLLSMLVAALLPARATPWQMALPGFLYFVLTLTPVVDRRGRRWAYRRLRADEAPGKSG
ncbi:MAG TPA: TMEM175 family protein [Pseudoxanthomonas sp.]|nr:TMEM175 family protein [Pseudoxanthomonas sp.]